jgi:DNA-binding MarR family transcriptional regulator
VIVTIWQMPDPERFDLAQVLNYLIVQVAATLEHAFTELVAAEGLTVRQFGILALLSGDTALTAAEIARRLNVTAQSIGPQIDTLVARDLVQRDAHPGRGRPIGVHLTAHGRETFARAALLAREEQERTTGHLDPEERRRLMEQLREIARRAAAPRG